jgi:hypothetical protein
MILGNSPNPIQNDFTPVTPMPVHPPPQFLGPPTQGTGGPFQIPQGFQGWNNLGIPLELQRTIAQRGNIRWPWANRIRPIIAGSPGAGTSGGLMSGGNPLAFNNGAPVSPMPIPPSPELTPFGNADTGNFGPGPMTFGNAQAPPVFTPPGWAPNPWIPDVRARQAGMGNLPVQGGG